MYLMVSIAKQKLALMQADHVIHEYSISTATRGPGEQSGSYQTPRGWHEVIAKFGDELPLNTYFTARRPQGVWSAAQAADPERDWVLTRILWLGGLECGTNFGGDVDTQRRYIYIHGTASEDKLGQPASHGCIRMANVDVITVFERTPIFTRVLIKE